MHPWRQKADTQHAPNTHLLMSFLSVCSLSFCVAAVTTCVAVACCDSPMKLGLHTPGITSTLVFMCSRTCVDRFHGVR